MKKAPKENIGVYIDYNILTLSSISTAGGKLLIKNMVRIPIDYKVEGIIKPLSLNTDFFNEKQKWVVDFKDTIRKMQIKSASVFVSLSHNLSITRFFTMPFIEKKFWAKSIPLESRKHIPVAFDELGYDFYASPIDKNIGVLFSVTQKKSTEFIMKIFSESNLEVELVEPLHFTLFRFARYLTDIKEPYIFIYGKDDDFYMILTWNEIPTIYRYISFSKSMSFSERRTLDIKGMITFSQRSIPGLDIKKIVICGNNIDAISNIVKNETNIEPTVLDIQTKLQPHDLPTDVVFSASAGLLEVVKTIPYLIDISERQKDKRLEKIANSSTFVITAVISIILLFLTLLSFVRLYSYSTKLQTYMEQSTQISELDGMPINSVESKIKDMSMVSSIIKSLIDSKEYFTPKLAAIADTIPKDIWVTNLTFTNPIIVDQTQDTTVNLTLESETILFGESRTYFIEYLIKELKKREAFKIFVLPSGKIDYETKEPELLSHSLDMTQPISKITLRCVGKK